jgi:hypothetical protein
MGAENPGGRASRAGTNAASPVARRVFALFSMSAIPSSSEFSFEPLELGDRPLAILLDGRTLWDRRD